MIDLHCHILPGIDDGPATIEDAVTIARAAAAAGTQTVIATSHVDWTHRNDAATIAGLVAEVNERLLAEEIELEVLPGAEIAMTRVEDIDPEELARLTLGGGPSLLIEPPFTPIVSGLDWLVFDLQRRGYRVLLAHPERCPAFHRDRALLEALVGAGVLTSVTAGSLVGRFGRDARRFALDLFRDGLVHNVASDAHSEHRRPPGIAAELEEAGLAPLEHWLTVGVPQAILDGSAVPPRPDADIGARVGGARSSRWRGFTTR
jgi:protein-tyrosine phosphatase